MARKLSNLEKHLVPCPSCGKDVLDHMTECPFCHAELTPHGYKGKGADDPNLKRVKRIANVIGFAIAAVLIVMVFVRNCAA